jgi:hypothetical protein
MDEELYDRFWAVEDAYWCGLDAAIREGWRGDGGRVTHPTRLRDRRVTAELAALGVVTARVPAAGFARRRGVSARAGSAEALPFRPLPLAPCG